MLDAVAVAAKASAIIFIMVGVALSLVLSVVERDRVARGPLRRTTRMNHPAGGRGILFSSGAVPRHS